MLEFTDSPHERVTAATDMLLALVAVGGVCYLQWSGSEEIWKINIWSLAFGGIAGSGFLGSIAHGLRLSATVHQRVWQWLNLALGLAVALFVVGVVYDAWGVATARKVLPAMLLTGAGFYLITWMIPGAFVVFIIYEALALFFAGGAYTWLALGARMNGSLLLALGIFVRIIAAGLQTQKSISVKLIWELDHNGLFHIVQIAGLILMMMGLRRSLMSS